MRVTHLLQVLVLFTSFNGLLFAQDKSDATSGERTSVRSSIARLAEVKELWIDIQTEPNSADVKTIFLNQIKNKCSEKLREAGIIVISDPNLCSWSANSKIPVFQIRINIFEVNDTPIRVFYAKASFARIVTLATMGRPFIYKANVWESKPVMQSDTEQNLPEVLTVVILKQIDAFIDSWSAANKPDISDANQPRPQLRKVTEDKDTKPAKQQAVEATFVASKNSQVFHKASCPSAQRISTNNLVSYATRDEAVAAGKRPCERCNP